MGLKPTLCACLLIVAGLGLAPTTAAAINLEEVERYIPKETVCIGLTDQQEELISEETPIYVSGPKMCAWAGVGWETFDDCGDPPNEYSVCAAPTGEGGGGSHGGLGYAVFDQDVGAGVGSCEWGDVLSLLTWDSCTESFDHGDPHWHDTRDSSDDCHFVISTATNERYGTVPAEDESCGADISTDFIRGILRG